MMIGSVLGITFYSTGCVHYGLSPLTLKKDGEMGEWVWFDESRCVLVKGSALNEPKVGRSGPDMNPKSY